MYCIWRKENCVIGIDISCPLFYSLVTLSFTWKDQNVLCRHYLRPQNSANVISHPRMRNRFKIFHLLNENILITDNRPLTETGGSDKLPEIHLCLFQKYLPNERALIRWQSRCCTLIRINEILILCLTQMKGFIY